MPAMIVLGAPKVARICELELAPGAASAAPKTICDRSSVFVNVAVNVYVRH